MSPGLTAAPGAAAALLGLSAAVCWGASDFTGGVAARRAPALLVVAAGHLTTFVALTLLCLATHATLPTRAEWIYGLVGGVEGAGALALFYRALAMGEMGLTAALTGLATASVPVLFGLWRQGWPGWSAAAGLALAAVAIWLIAYAPGHNTPPLALLFGALAGVGFGVQLVLLHLASATGVLWGTTAARLGGLLGVGLALVFLYGRRAGSTVASTERIHAGEGQGRLVWRRPLTGFWRIGILAGALDATGNITYALASHLGRLDAAAMIAGLYPGCTILLAALLLHERPTGRQRMGMGFALAAVFLLSR